MAHTNRPAEQRLYPRYPLREEIFLSIQGDKRPPSCSLTDLSEAGAGCLAEDNTSALEDRFILCDLISQNEQIILRSLTARVIFSDNTPKKKTNSTSGEIRRYGLQFINLTPLQKRQLSMITRKYGESPQKTNLPWHSTGLIPMVPWKNSIR